jgi:hypothetical protein
LRGAGPTSVGGDGFIVGHVLRSKTLGAPPALDQPGRRRRLEAMTGVNESGLTVNSMGVMQTLADGSLPLPGRECQAIERQR